MLLFYQKGFASRVNFGCIIFISVPSLGLILCVCLLSLMYNVIGIQKMSAFPLFCPTLKFHQKSILNIELLAFSRQLCTGSLSSKLCCDYLTGGTSVSGAVQCPPHETRMIVSVDTSQMVSV